MSAYLWRLTDHHAVLYTDDRSILNAALAYSRFPHQDLTHATTYHHGKNNRIFAWQFTFPMAVWNGLVRHLGRAALTFLDEEKPAVRKATPAASQPEPRKPQKPVAAKPEAPKRVSTSKSTAPKPSAEEPARRRAAQSGPDPASAVVPGESVQTTDSAATKPARLKTGGKPADANLPKPSATAPAVKEERAALAPAPAKALEEHVAPASSSRKPSARKPSPTSPVPAVAAKREQNLAMAPATPAPRPESRTQRSVPTKTASVVRRGSRATADETQVGTGAATKAKMSAKAPPLAPMAAPRVPSAKPEDTAAAPSASRPQTRKPAGVAATKPLPATGPKGKSVPVPPAIIAAKPTRATAVPAKAAPAARITEVTRPARSATPTAGGKRASVVQGELLTVPATASPARSRTREKVPR